MVPIFTYRDERKLFAVIGAIAIAAVVALVQLDSAKTGKPSFIAAGVTSGAVFVQEAVAAIGDGTRGLATTLSDAPHLYDKNAKLAADNDALRAENARLRETLAQVPEAVAIERVVRSESQGIPATTVGFDPENLSRTVTVDRGSDAGVKRDAGVIDADGVVGRVIAVNPASSTVLLVTDAESKVPAVVQRGRWWGIATGTNAHVRLQYVSQDAKLKIGDAIVTGEGRSFHAGLPIGTISHIDHPEGALYQTAIVTPAVAFGRLSRVVILPPSADTESVGNAGSP